jgi:hypothetical protein
LKITHELVGITLRILEVSITPFPFSHQFSSSPNKTFTHSDAAAFLALG